MRGTAEENNLYIITEGEIDMYNNGFYTAPGYQPYNGAMNDTLNQFKGQYMNQIPAPNQQPKNCGNDMIWVQSEAGAKAFLVAPNTTVVLWDTESPTIYVKSADMNGVPSMRILDFVERGVPAQSVAVVNYATTEELNQIKEQINALTEKCDALTAEKSKKVKAKSEEE